MWKISYIHLKVKLHVITYVLHSYPQMHNVFCKTVISLAWSSLSLNSAYGIYSVFSSKLFAVTKSLFTISFSNVPECTIWPLLALLFTIYLFLVCLWGSLFFHAFSPRFSWSNFGTGFIISVDNSVFPVSPAVVSSWLCIVSFCHLTLRPVGDVWWEEFIFIKNITFRAGFPVTLNFFSILCLVNALLTDFAIMPITSEFDSIQSLRQV